MEPSHGGHLARPTGRALRVGALVVLAGFVLTAALVAATSRVHDANESRLLRQRTREAGVVLAGQVTAVEQPLYATAELAEATGAAPAPLHRVLDPMSGPGRPFVSASVWKVGDPTKPVLVVGDRPVLASRPLAERRAFLERARGDRLSVMDLRDDPSLRLGYARSSRGTHVSYVAYAEGALPRNRMAVIRADNAFVGLGFALYLGDRESQSALLYASTADLPLSGRRATQVVPFGDSRLLLVMTPASQLGGRLMARLPSIVAVVGVLLSLIAGLLVERLVRRRVHAEQLADTLRGVAEENGRLYREQRTVAQVLQRSLLPDRLPVLDPVSVAVRYEPGAEDVDVGGDWYDVLETGTGDVVFVVGDVSGRGLRAATVMASVRHAVRAYALEGHAPAAILEKLGNVLSVARDGHFATVLCGRTDAARRSVAVASAGHPAPIVVDTGGPRFLAVPVGLPVGVGASPTYETATFEPKEGTTLLAFTDGLFERRGEDIEAGLERLRRTVGDLTSGEVDLDGLVTAVVDRLAPGAGHDDIALLGLRWAR